MGRPRRNAETLLSEVIRARVTPLELKMLKDVSYLINPDEENISNGVRFCVQFTGKVLALLPDIVIEATIDTQESGKKN